MTYCIVVYIMQLSTGCRGLQGLQQNYINQTQNAVHTFPNITTRSPENKYNIFTYALNVCVKCCLQGSFSACAHEQCNGDMFPFGSALKTRLFCNHAGSHLWSCSCSLNSLRTTLTPTQKGKGYEVLGRTHSRSLNW